MTALLAALWSRVSGYALAAGAVLAALGWAFLNGRAAGRRSAEHDALTETLEHRRIRDAVDRDVARTDDPGAELLRDWRRPE